MEVYIADMGIWIFSSNLAKNYMSVYTLVKEPRRQNIWYKHCVGHFGVIVSKRAPA